MSRRQHNFALPLIGVLLGGAAASSIGYKSNIHALSLGTAYTSLVYIGLTHAIGPLSVLLGRRVPISTMDRRDIGIWGGIFAVIHVAAGLNVHMGGDFWAYFFRPDIQPTLMTIRYDPFGLANHSGLVATLIILILLAISNTVSLRRLRATRWKRIQRANYILGGVIVIHGFIYQILEWRNLLGAGIMIFICAAACLLQIEGVRRRKKIPRQ